MRRLPALLAVLNSLFLFFPFRERLIGLGDDPFFNLWTLEYDWKVISRSGPWELFFEKGWAAPIFHPFPLGLALSENQAYLALLSWPIRALSGNGTWTMNFLAFLMNLAAFVFASLWLKSIGVKRLHMWGGLLFAACGWVQSHSAHYQNICVFVLPLALWLWARMMERPSVGRAIWAAVGFGWIIGWNVYFQSFANLILTVLVVYEGVRRPELRRYFAITILLAVLLELPLATHHLQARELLGNPGVSLEEYRGSSANLLSFLSHYCIKTVVSRVLSFYPLRAGGVESSGFLGLTWMAMAIYALVTARARAQRLLALTAFAVYWVSLGPDFLLFNLLRPFPGIGELRAVGRFQLLFAVASLPVVLLALEGMKKRRGPLLLALVFLELLPAQFPGYVDVPSRFFAESSEFSRRISEFRQGEAVLSFPFGIRQFQLYSLQSDHPIFDGYSGRFPPSFQLLGRSIQDWGWNEDRLRVVAAFSQAPLWVSLTPAWQDRLVRLPFLRPLGCYEMLELRPCLFALDQAKLAPAPGTIRIAQDVEWRYARQGDWHVGRLVASREGVLSQADWATCVLRETLKFSFFPAISTTSPMPVGDLREIRFKKGDTILERVSKQAIFRLPEAIRPEKTYSFRCRGP